MSPDEWDVGRLDVAGYLARIGVAGDLPPDGATLSRLHRAHVASIPFENLDVLLGRGVDVDLPAVAAKLVDRGRGGYCYEHGTLFSAVLVRLGFTVHRLLARVGDDRTRPGPRTHMTLDVRAGEQRWFADVGFGSGLLWPLPWHDGATATQGTWLHGLVLADDGVWEHRQHRPDGRWETLYRVTEEPQHVSDVRMANHFTSTYPASPFVGHLLAIRKNEITRHVLRDRVLVTTDAQGAEKSRTLDDGELAATLRGDFRIPLSDAEIRTVLDRLPS
ncbi:MAG: arylamine N-acetyltransferase [Pseudonocardia sp.]|nr:arylamine N-acetyltransferase [Pseudonocardia sp.]